MDAAINDAMAEHTEIRTSVKKLSENFNIPQTSLMWQLNGGIKIVGQNVYLVMMKKKNLKSCVGGPAELDFAMTLNDVGELVESYVAIRNIKGGLDFLVIISCPCLGIFF